jgi:DNA processing protein
MDKLYFWLTLKAIKGLGEKSIKQLYTFYKDPRLIFESHQEELEQVVGKEKAFKIKNTDLSFDPQEVLKQIEREGIKWLTLDDENYPKLLRDIPDPPPVLFYIGHIKDMLSVAVIGTRRPEYYSIGFTKDLIRQLVSMSFGIVSGGAKGIDLLSHRYAVEFGGYTVCVLGFGILNTPKYLEFLLSKGSCFISEFLPTEPPSHYTFPRRNRIISGMSQYVFVVEAGINSGALITAEYAYKQKRPVYAHIGVGKSDRWDGCAKLINEGKAKFFRSVQEIILSSNAQKESDGILNLLVSPKTFDQLIAISGISPEELLRILTDYELSGKIVKMGAYYRLA